MLKYKKSIMGINFFLISFLLFVKTSFAQDVNVDVSVNKNNIRLGEVFSYQIRVRVKSKVLPEIIAPELSDFKIISRRQMHDYKIQKGRIESSLSYYFLLAPVREGDFEIRGFKVKFGSKEYEVEAVKIKVGGVKKTVPEVYPQGEQIWI